MESWGSENPTRPNSNTLFIQNFSVAFAATCGYSVDGMKRKTFRYSPVSTGRPLALRETATLEELPVPQVNVRAAKDQLSSLLEQAARGQEIIITSDGQPKARLGPAHLKRKRFHTDWELLGSMPVTPGPTAEAILREERDGRA